MITKKLFIFLFILLSYRGYTQKRTSLECLNRDFYILAHVVTDSLYSPAAYQFQVQQVIDELNQVWEPICVKFHLCKYRIDSNYNFSDWHQDTMETEYIALNFEPRVINVVIVNSILDPAGAAGYATLRGISRRDSSTIVVIGADRLTWIHEMGHYFGLKHTFEPTIASADNANCDTKDDGICDTPPDPDPSGSSHNNCEYNGQHKDANGKYYNPLVENYMSYYGACRKSFTHMQYERMVSTYKQDPEAKF